MVAVAAVMTIGVYGIVAGIVKLDDAGLWLSKRGGWQATLGGWILAAAPWLMKALSVVGTLAMFLVGGGILTHGVPAVAHWIEDFAAEAIAGAIEALGVPTFANLVIGVVAGAVTLAVVTGVQRIFRKPKLQRRRTEPSPSLRPSAWRAAWLRAPSRAPASAAAAAGEPCCRPCDMPMSTPETIAE